MNRHTNQSTGFTLIEMMVTVAIIAIVLSIAAPEWQQMIASQKVRTTTQELYSSMRLARNEAIKLRQDVRIVSEETGWENGWVVVTRQDDGTYKTFEQCLINQTDCLKLTNLIQAKPVIITTTDLLDTITYQRDGRVSPVAAVLFLCDRQKLTTRRSISFSLSGEPNISLAGDCP